eukprot:1160290-Pelagomonas_calceolata.AAC.4
MHAVRKSSWGVGGVKRKERMPRAARPGGASAELVDFSVCHGLLGLLGDEAQLNVGLVPEMRSFYSECKAQMGQMVRMRRHGMMDRTKLWTLDSTGLQWLLGASDGCQNRMRLQWDAGCCEYTMRPRLQRIWGGWLPGQDEATKQDETQVGWWMALSTEDEAQTAVGSWVSGGWSGWLSCVGGGWSG